MNNDHNTLPETYGDVGKCPQCGQQSRSYSRGCSTCGYGRPLADQARQEGVRK